MNEGWLGGVRSRSKGRKLRSFTDSEMTEGTPIARGPELFAGFWPKSILVRGVFEGNSNLRGFTRVTRVSELHERRGPNSLTLAFSFEEVEGSRPSLSVLSPRWIDGVNSAVEKTVVRRLPARLKMRRRQSSRRVLVDSKVKTAVRK